MELRALARFFPLTDVRLSVADQTVYTGDVLLLNRDAVAVLGRSYREVNHFFATDARADAGDEVA